MKNSNYFILFCILSLVIIENIPVSLHFQGKQYYRCQLVIFKNNQTLHIICAKGE